MSFHASERDRDRQRRTERDRAGWEGRGWRNMGKEKESKGERKANVKTPFIATRCIFLTYC